MTSAATDQTATVEIKGLDIYDPIKDEVKSRDVHDINYWMVDTDFRVLRVFRGPRRLVDCSRFCTGAEAEAFSRLIAARQSASLL